MGWLQELFCPEHGLSVLIPALINYWGVWRLGMSFHLMQLKARIKDEPSWS